VDLSRSTVIAILILQALTLLFSVVEAGVWVFNIFMSGNPWTVAGILALLGVISVLVFLSSPDIDIDIDSSVTFEDEEETP
jgi:hypothetical protein